MPQMTLPQNCPVEISAAPLITTCPPDTSYLLLFNQTNPQSISLIALSTLRQCILAGLKFIFNQFTIGQAGSPMNAGDNQLVITLTAGQVPVTGSVFMTLGGSELPQEDDTQVSYGAVISNVGNVYTITINFDQNVSNGQQYILHYTYTS